MNEIWELKQMSARGYGKTQCTHRRLTSRAKHKRLSTTPWGKCHRPKMRHISSTPQAQGAALFLFHTSRSKHCISPPLLGANAPGPK
ncbi:hypothetical protein AWH67_00180 [Bartonella bacilliformis]|nr:hypothetical protein AWH67_00180 [Bartonella bacilliformis]